VSIFQAGEGEGEFSLIASGGVEARCDEGS